MPHPRAECPRSRPPPLLSNTKLAALSGTHGRGQFLDANRDGARQASEPAIEGFAFFTDLDDDLQPDEAGLHRVSSLPHGFG